LAARWFQFNRESGGSDLEELRLLLFALASQPPRFCLPVDTARGPAIKQYQPTSVEWTNTLKKKPAVKSPKTTLVEDHYRILPDDQPIFWIWPSLTLDPAAEQLLDRLLEGRNRRPPRDPVNALLSLGYSILTKDLTIACYAVGFDPMMGFYHQPRFGRPALALDLMEPFRPLIVDSAVISAINTRMVTATDFVRSGDAVALTPAGRKSFYHAYELRMDTFVTHPTFEYRVSYRRLLEVQARLLARVLEGEIGDYPVFITR